MGEEETVSELVAYVYPERGADGVERWTIDAMPSAFAANIESEAKAKALAALLTNNKVVVRRTKPPYRRGT